MQPIVRPDDWPLVKVISGGQTGADQAALRAAKRRGYVTGGQAPLGWRTDAGPAPWLGADYDLTEATTSDYRQRTFANVRDAQATIWFGTATSPGFQQTRQATLFYRRAFLQPVANDQLKAWIRKHRIKVLNVAGNREASNPGIGAMVEQFLLNSLYALDSVQVRTSTESTSNG